MNVRGLFSNYFSCRAVVLSVIFENMEPEVDVDMQLNDKATLTFTQETQNVSMTSVQACFEDIVETLEAARTKMREMHISQKEFAKNIALL